MAIDPLLLQNLSPEQQATWNRKFQQPLAPIAITATQAANSIPEPAPLQFDPFAKPFSPYAPRPSNGPAPIAITAAQAVDVVDAKNTFANNNRNERNATNLDGATFATPNELNAPNMSVQPVQYAPMRVIPGQMAPAKVETKEGIPIPDSVKAEFDYADGMAQRAVESSYKAGEAQAAAEAGYLDKHIAAQKNREFQNQIRHDAQKADLSGAQDQVAAAMRDASETPEAESPYFLPGEAGKFLGAIGVALGAAVAATTGGPNMALAQINGAIQTSVDRQKRALAAKDRKVDASNSILAQMKTKFGDMDIAENATWAIYSERAKTELMKATADTKSPELLARRDAAFSGLQEQQAERIKRFSDQTAARVERTDMMTKDIVVGGGGGGGPPKIKDLNEQVNKLASMNAAQKLPETQSKLESIDRSIDTLGKDPIEGIGSVADTVIDKLPFGPQIYKEVYGERAVIQKQVLQGVKNELYHELSGAAVSESEEGRLKKQLEGANDSQSLKRVLQDIRQAAYYKQRNAEASVQPEAVAEYKRRGGPIVTMNRQTKLTPYIKPAQGNK